MPIIAFHLGHLGEVASHDHWVAGAAIAGALAAGLWGWLGRKDEGEGSEEADEPETEAAEGEKAPA